MHLNVCITVMEILLGIDTKWLFWLLGICVPRQYGHFKSFWKKCKLWHLKHMYTRYHFSYFLQYYFNFLLYNDI